MTPPNRVFTVFFWSTNKNKTNTVFSGFFFFLLGFIRTVVFMKMVRTEQTVPTESGLICGAEEAEGGRWVSLHMTNCN